MTLAKIFIEKDILKLFHADEKKVKNKIVGSFMTWPAPTYRENDSLGNVCDFSMANYLRRNPIVLKEEKVVGIISRPDIINNITKQKRQSAQVHSETDLISPVP